MATSIDLDALRAAREAKREADAEAPGFTFGGERFELPVEAPFAWSEAWAHGNVGEGFRVLMGDEQYERFLAHEPTTRDTGELSKHLARLYLPGLSVGELAASVDSSSNGSS